MTNADRTNIQTPLTFFFFLEWTESFNSSRREPLAFEGFNLDDFLRIKQGYNSNHT
mgnify:FL=1